MKLKHVIESQQFTKESLEELFDVAHIMEKLSTQVKTLTNKIMISLFYEPSTRTRLSFESAMIRLGGSVASTENAQNFSSAAKGETLEDTIRVLSGYGDVIVLRHHEAGAAHRASEVSEIPIINAGDGAGQHPTQSLLDIFTIKKEIGHIDGTKIAMVGDLANGRTVRSLAYLLAKYNGIKMYFVSPPNVKMGADIKEHLEKHGVDYEENSDLREVAGKVDVIYQTRVQRERFASIDEYEKAHGIYIIDNEILDILPKSSIVMHPLPRVDEIKYEVDKDPRAAYFRQAHNGLYIRMALLSILLENR
ncbi:MAG: aspartate carbamoyltransferase [Brevinematales bacterium]|nr:aspartate carbamoyltransferase [Brevinematales bacterium]